MTDTKWTSGPWTARRSSAPSDGEYDYGIGANVGGREQCIAETFGRVSETERPNAEANATLIAAAPELYEALGMVMTLARIKWGNLDPDANEVFEQAKAVRAKARGEDQ